MRHLRQLETTAKGSTAGLAAADVTCLPKRRHNRGALHKLLQAALHFASRQQHAPSTDKAPEPNIRAEADDRPVIPTARVRFFQSHHIADDERDRVGSDHRALSVMDWLPREERGFALHQSGNAKAAGECAHLLFGERGGSIHSVLNGHGNQILEDIDVVRINNTGID